MKVSPLAGKPTESSLLVNVPRLITAYYVISPWQAQHFKLGDEVTVTGSQTAKSDRFDGDIFLPSYKGYPPEIRRRSRARAHAEAALEEKP